MLKGITRGKNREYGTLLKENKQTRKLVSIKNLVTFYTSVFLETTAHSEQINGNL